MLIAKLSPVYIILCFKGKLNSYENKADGIIIIN